VLRDRVSFALVLLYRQRQRRGIQTTSIVQAFTPEKDLRPTGCRALVVPADMALKFAPFGSEIELPFYTALSQFKIDHDKLDDSARSVLGLYEPRPNASPEEGSRMRVLGNALTSVE
jgi:hypothetical protein